MRPSEETPNAQSNSSAALAQCAECCWIGGQHHPNCSQPLVVTKFYDDSDEERRAAVSLERANAGAAEWLLLRGMNPHAYRAGSGR